MTTLTVTERCAMMADVAAARSPEWRHTPIGKVAVRWLDALLALEQAEAAWAEAVAEGVRS